MLDRRFLSSFDFGTLVTAFALLGVGLMMVASIEGPARTSSLAQKQTLAIGIGFALFLFLVAVDYHTLAAFAFPLYASGLVLLVVVLLIGRNIANTHGWIEIGPLRLQPSEPMKPLTVLMLASILGEGTGEKPDLKLLGKIVLIVAVPAALILAEPDMGTVLTYIPLLAVALFLGGLRWRVMIPLIIVGALAVPLGWKVVLKPYQRERILTVLDPSRDPAGVGYQVQQSRIAIGSGGLSGKGMGAGTQSRLKFLPQEHTDFIFAFLAEEHGFLGAGAVLALLAFLILRILQTARLARDRLGLHLAALVGMLVCGQSLINLGMVLGVLPTIGVPLPLVSYGGSSAMATLMALGIAANVRMRRFVN